MVVWAALTSVVGENERNRRLFPNVYRHFRSDKILAIIPAPKCPIANHPRSILSFFITTYLTGGRKGHPLSSRDKSRSQHHRRRFIQITHPLCFFAALFIFIGGSISYKVYVTLRTYNNPQLTKNPSTPVCHPVFL
jgi:hypothetical protein